MLIGSLILHRECLRTEIIQDSVFAQSETRAQAKRHRQHVQHPETKTCLNSLSPIATRMKEEPGSLEPITILGRVVGYGLTRPHRKRQKGTTECPLATWAAMPTTILANSLRSNLSIQGMTGPVMVPDGNLGLGPMRPKWMREWGTRDSPLAVISAKPTTILRTSLFLRPRIAAARLQIIAVFRNVGQPWVKRTGRNRMCEG